MKITIWRGRLLEIASDYFSEGEWLSAWRLWRADRMLSRRRTNAALAAKVQAISDRYKGGDPLVASHLRAAAHHLNPNA